MRALIDATIRTEVGADEVAAAEAEIDAATARLRSEAKPRLTGTTTLRYLRTTRLGNLHAEARIARTEGAKTYAVGHLADEEGITVEAEGVFIQPRWARDQFKTRWARSLLVIVGWVGVAVEEFFGVVGAVDFRWCGAVGPREAAAVDDFGLVVAVGDEAVVGAAGEEQAIGISLAIR